LGKERFARVWTGFFDKKDLLNHVKEQFKENLFRRTNHWLWPEFDPSGIKIDITPVNGDALSA